MHQLDSNTLPRTILVKRSNETSSLVTVSQDSLTSNETQTPIPTPRRTNTGNSSLVPVEVNSSGQSSPRPTKKTLIQMEVESVEAEPKEEGIIMKIGIQSLDNHLSCPFELLGCRKVGKQREIQLHIRDDRVFHAVLVRQSIQTLGKESQSAYRRIYNHMSKFWVALDRAETMIQKYGPQYVFHIPDIGKEMYACYKVPKKPNLQYSDVFESHRFGYKMIAIVAPFGDGPARREYISVFVSLVKGDFDPVLEWPFRCPVSFALKKPGTQSKFEKTFDPLEHENIGRFERPTVGRNRAFGFQFFCPIMDLGNFSSMDNVYLEIFVDLTRLDEKKPKAIASEY